MWLYKVDGRVTESNGSRAIISLRFKYQQTHRKMPDHVEGQFVFAELSGKGWWILVLAEQSVTMSKVIFGMCIISILKSRFSD